MAKFNSLTQELLAIATKEALMQVTEELGEEYENKGVFIRVYHMPPTRDAESIGLVEGFAGWIGGTGNALMLTQISNVSNERAVLLSRYMKDFGLTSSSQSPDPVEKGLRVQFAGAVTTICQVDELGLRPSNLMFSVHGLGGIDDETVALLTAMKLPWKTQGVSEIIAKTNNSTAARYIFS